MSLEKWKQFRNSGYWVSSQGRVKSTKNGVRILKPGKDASGYFRVVLRLDKQSNRFLLHRIVMEVFKGPSNLQVNHIDENKSNNNLENLEYVTPSENKQHSSRLNLDDIKNIRASKCPGKVLATLYQTSTPTISNIKTGRTWKNV